MSAQVFQHPNHAASPIVQLPRKGRLPATVGKEDMSWYTLHCAEMAGEVRAGLDDLVQQLQEVQA